MVENNEMKPKTAMQTIFKCKNYDPVSEMIWVEYTPPNGGEPRPSLYLPINARIRWFNNWCAENGLKGVIDEADVSIIPELNMVRAICRVSIDGELVATGISAVCCDPTNQTIIPLCATYAKGRALANAGFSIAASQDDDFKMEMQEGDLQQIANVDDADNTAALKTLEILQNTDNPLTPKAGTAAEPCKPEPELSPGAKQRKKLETAPGPSNCVNAAAAAVAVVSGRKPTLEEARSFMWPFNNQHRGKTIGQVIDEEGMKTLSWYVTDDGKGKVDRFRRDHPGFIESIQVLCGN